LLSSTSSSTASVSWAFFVNLTVDGQRPLGFTLVDLVNGQHQLDLLSLWTSSPPDCQRDFARLSFADLVSGQHPLDFLLLSTSSSNNCQNQLDLLSSTLSLTASVSWAFFVNLTVDGQRPLGFTLVVNLVVDGQRPLDLSSLTLLSTASVCWTFIVVDLIVNSQRTLDLHCR